jgi:hypothetical protein
VALRLLKPPERLVQRLTSPLVSRRQQVSTLSHVLTIRARPKRDLKRVEIYDVIVCFLKGSGRRNYFGRRGRRVTVLPAVLLAIKDGRGVGFVPGSGLSASAQRLSEPICFAGLSPAFRAAVVTVVRVVGSTTLPPKLVGPTYYTPIMPRTAGERQAGGQNALEILRFDPGGDRGVQYRRPIV